MQTIACHGVLGRKKRLWGQRSKLTKLKRWKWVVFGVEAWGGGDLEKGLFGDFKIGSSVGTSSWAACSVEGLNPESS
jgi:hypothetical protein